MLKCLIFPLIEQFVVRLYLYLSTEDKLVQCPFSQDIVRTNQKNV